VFDYRGTLDSLEDPHAFLVKLRMKNPESYFILYSGCVKAEIEKERPGLFGAFDLYLPKPESLRDAVTASGTIIYVDDDVMMRNMASRLFKGRCVLLSPSAIQSLLE
jgi:hypothetical protein